MEKIKINKAKNRPGKADKEASNNRKRLYLFLKVISLAFIVIFCIMLIFGIIRWYDFKSSHNSYPMQQSQIDMARNAVSADLDSAGDNISDYDVRISDDVRGFPSNEGPSKNIIQVSLNSNPNVKNPDIKDRESEEQMYLIDAGSGEILMHSKTMFYDGMQSPRMESPMGSPKHRGFLPDFNFMMLMHPDRWSR